MYKLRHYIILGVLIAVLINFVVLPVAGYDIHRVSGDSMEPRLHTCDLVIVDTTQDNLEDVSVGDIIVYETQNSNIIHKIIGKHMDPRHNFDPFLTTKGINNETLDGKLVNDEDVIGKMIFIIPSSIVC